MRTPRSASTAHSTVRSKAAPLPQPSDTAARSTPSWLSSHRDGSDHHVPERSRAPDVRLRHHWTVPNRRIAIAAPRDLVAVARLIERRPDLATSDLTGQQQAMWARMMSTDDLTVYLAWHGSDAVGTTALLVMPHITYACRPSAFIESMYVRDEHRRRGVARMMIERLLGDARAAGCNKVQLLTHKRHEHDGAHALYRSMGFDAEAEGFRLYLDA